MMRKHQAAFENRRSTEAVVPHRLKLPFTPDIAIGIHLISPFVNQHHG
jgi:hypothetical protein